MKVLNLYAGIGGNRKDWEGCAVTAVEYTQDIADIYKGFFPDDEVVVADAHQYLLDNYDRFDFIWASPPCQSHSRMIRSGRNRKPRYPDFKLYEEIVFLQYNFKGLWVVENVIPYYKPLIEPILIGRHTFWKNFHVDPIEEPKFKNFINSTNLAAKENLMDWLGLHYEKNIYYEGNHCPTQILRNCVHPIVGKHILDSVKKALS
jgi:DNA (cytosine-5)-methyltransferase 1